MTTLLHWQDEREEKRAEDETGAGGEALALRKYSDNVCDREILKKKNSTIRII